MQPLTGAISYGMSSKELIMTMKVHQENKYWAVQLWRILVHWWLWVISDWSSDLGLFYCGTTWISQIENGTFASILFGEKWLWTHVWCLGYLPPPPPPTPTTPPSSEPLQRKRWIQSNTSLCFSCVIFNFTGLLSNWKILTYNIIITQTICNITLQYTTTLYY